MKGFLKEFREFISRGNVMDMAVGIIIGGAFTAIVNSLVDDIISPLLGLIGGGNFDTLSVQIGGVTLFYGKFITAIINFILIALVLFLIIKAMNKAREAGEKLVKKNKEEEAPEPTEKECPFCKSMIPIGATRCPHCTSELTK